VSSVYPMSRAENAANRSAIAQTSFNGIFRWNIFMIGWALMRWKAVRFLAIVLLVSVAVSEATWCQPSPPAAAKSGKRHRPAFFARHFFLITIDTLRADHVGCYGYKASETPALDALAADGVRFTQAFTHSPITNTSHIHDSYRPLAKRPRSDGFWNSAFAATCNRRGAVEEARLSKPLRLSEL